MSDRDIASKTENRPYKVVTEVEAHACPTCHGDAPGHIVVGPDGIGFGTTYYGDDGKDEADDLADMLNDAFEKGIQSRGAVETPAPVSKTVSALDTMRELYIVASASGRPVTITADKLRDVLDEIDRLVAEAQSWESYVAAQERKAAMGIAAETPPAASKDGLNDLIHELESTAMSAGHPQGSTGAMHRARAELREAIDRLFAQLERSRVEPATPQSPIVSLTSKDRSIALAARLRTIAGVYDTPNAKTLREAANILDLTRPYSDETHSPQSPVATQASKERVFRLPAAQELLEARQEIELLRAEVEKYKAWAASCEPAPDSVRAAFKNFHRLLCERFNYLHDEKDWERDQLSLIEWIAERELKAMRTAAETITPQSPVEPVASNERLTLPWRIEWRNSPIADTGDYDCVLSIQASNGETVVDSWNPEDYVEEAFQKIVHAVNAHEWNKRTVEPSTPQLPIELLLLELREFVEQVGSMSVYTQQIRRTQLLKDIDTAVAAAAKAPQSSIAFPRAWGCDVANGWTIDPTLLITIHDEISDEEFGTSQEGVEVVLLAYERISNAAKASAAESLELSASEAQSFGKAFASSPRRLSTEANGELRTCTEKDAARYEWLRENWPALATTVVPRHGGMREVIDIQVSPAIRDLRFDPQSLDHAIDAKLFAERERDAVKAPVEPSPCEHLRSELLAEKRVAGEPLFQMHKCLDCKLIFRVRTSLKTSANHICTDGSRVAGPRENCAACNPGAKAP